MSEHDAWGQLVSLTDFESDPIQICADKFSIGRALGKVAVSLSLFSDTNYSDT